MFQKYRVKDSRLATICLTSGPDESSSMFCPNRAAAGERQAQPRLPCPRNVNSSLANPIQARHHTSRAILGATRTTTLGPPVEAMSHRLCILAFVALALSATAQLPAIPEPPLMLLGTVTDASTTQPVTLAMAIA